MLVSGKHQHIQAAESNCLGAPMDNRMDTNWMLKTTYITGNPSSPCFFLDQLQAVADIHFWLHGEMVFQM
jgi:hypothetical protein